ncbi:hypothetical protein, partial [Enterobacter asburiae]|uniref:hypothetical protein n=1 Tax=Enterobacter asburiae TaxID=61645 RepID=UPI001C400244
LFGVSTDGGYLLSSCWTTSISRNTARNRAVKVILGNTLRHFDSSGWRSNQWVFSPFDYYKSTLTA